MILGTILTLDADFIGTTTAYIGELFTDFQVLIALVIGLPLAFWVIRRAIGLARAK